MRGPARAPRRAPAPAPTPAPRWRWITCRRSPASAPTTPLLLGAFAAVFEKFGLTGPAAAAPAEVSGPSFPPAEGEENEREGDADAAVNKGPDAAAAAEQEAPKKEEEAAVLSKKQRKQLRRVKISELRQMCSRPDVVEVWDGNAPDPKLLVCLKSCRNTVPVPRHWCQKRKYLQGKRGLQKQPFQLPDFIAATGIEKIRQAYFQKENKKTFKQKQHNRMQPKRGNMDMDYEVLHDAFFKYQTKPTLTGYGDLYYEGKEYEPKLKVMKPGMLSQELKKALGMPDGAPPPWVTRMQFFGPPPSYPHLKIPGFNASISPGDSLGDGPDEEEPLDRSKHWGDLDEDEDEEEEKEEELIIHEEIEEGIRSIDTISSTPAGVEAPDVIDIQKLRKESDNQAERPLYQVLEQKEVRITHRAVFASSHAYVSLAKPTEYVLVGAQGTPSSPGSNFGDGPGELGKPPTDEGGPIGRSKNWGELDEEEEEEEELEDGKIEKGILEEEEEELEDGKIEKGILEEEEEDEVLEDGGIEKSILEEEEEEELEEGGIEEGTLEGLEEEELEDGEIEEATRKAEEAELEDGEIVQGIRQEEEEEEELEDGEIVEVIRQEEEEEEELEEGEIVEGIRQAGEEEAEALEEGEIVEGFWSGYTISSRHLGFTWPFGCGSSTPAGVETPDVIDLRKPWRKEPEKQAEMPLYQVLEQKEERVAFASAMYLSSHRYVLVGAQDKPSTSTSSSSGLKSKRRLERVDVTIHPDQLDAVEDALAAK
ncbi:splicing factor 3B subunit 2 isoform X3 [Triticum aestivum]|uniref:splicing factor 3B subunit 2 isoform X3 n=1 Tax=Triticum aestivum TaxID=4565 RepID=UPI001D01EBDC|nr:splicing factor 3B subunit 2-like isoform X3 [Triticum aestivum]